MSAPTWNDKFELPDGLYSTSDIKDYFEYIIKKHDVSLTNIPPVNFVFTKLKIGLQSKVRLNINLNF